MQQLEFFIKLLNIFSKRLIIGIDYYFVVFWNNNAVSVALSALVFEDFMT